MAASLVACSSGTKTEDAIIGEWKCLSIIASGKEQRMGENTFRFTVSSDGTSVYDYNLGTVEYQWRFDSKDETTGVLKYSFDSEGLISTVYYNSTDTLLLCESDEEGFITYIFAKSGADLTVTDETDYNQLLGFDMSALGITYITDSAAFRKISGDWTGTSLYMEETSLNLWPGMLSLSITDTAYTVTVIDEASTGKLIFDKLLEGNPVFDMDGNYEGVVLVYDETEHMIMLYEAESKTGMLFEANS